MNKSNLKFSITIGIIVLIFIVFYFLLDTFVKNNKSEYVEYLKDYKVNEYIPTYVSDENMAKIYLSDFIYTMYHDVEKSYSLLDEKYRDLKFGNIENYKKYISSLNYSSYDLVKYYKKNSSDYIVFGVYDQNGNFFAFKTDGVMQYKVYLDNYTIEI